MTEQLVLIRRVDPPGDSLPFHLVGSADGSLEGHDGGFETLDRPGRVGGVRYRGVAPYSVVLPLLTTRFDVQPGLNGSVEDKIEWLRNLAEHRSTLVRPPSVEVSGPLPYRVLNRRWVVNGVRPLDDLLVRDERTGHVAQQRVDLQLLEDVRTLTGGTPVQLAQRRIRQAPGDQTLVGTVDSRLGTWSWAGHQYTVVVAAEDGYTFAARVLGDASRWYEIARLNDLPLDPYSIVGGQRLRYPAT